MLINPRQKSLLNLIKFLSHRCNFYVLDKQALYKNINVLFNILIPHLNYYLIFQKIRDMSLYWEILDILFEFIRESKYLILDKNSDNVFSQTIIFMRESYRAYKKVQYELHYASRCITVLMHQAHSTARTRAFSPHLRIEHVHIMCEYEPNCARMHAIRTAVRTYMNARIILKIF